jgi:hypothetical protein
MLDTPQIIRTNAQLTAIIRLTIPRKEIRNVMGQGIAELMAVVAAQGLAPAWAEFDAWIAAAGHTPAPDLWECDISGPESNSDATAWCTELNRPLIR